MSMINDALKRAAQKPPGTAEVSATLQPTEERRHGFPVLTLLIALLPLISVGVWFLVKGLQMDERPQAVRVQTVAARAPEPPPVVVVPQAEPPAPKPLYKLQGIFWRPSTPSAVVNGKTVFVGDRVETARVTAIDQNSVTLAVDGESTALVIP